MNKSLDTIKKYSAPLINFFDPSDKVNKYIIISFFIILLIITLSMSYMYSILRLKDTQCDKLDLIYSDGKYATINGIERGKEETSSHNFFDNQQKCLLKNYFIKTAYNCCCGNGYKNDFVNICALRHCIKMGARCLDFEIYSYYSEPIVAASSVNHHSIKETYNFLKLSDVFKTINNEAFTKGGYQKDPLFLHFRILSSNKIIYDKIAEDIEKYLNTSGDRLLDINKYNYLRGAVEDQNANANDNTEILIRKHIGSNEFKSKIIIMVNTIEKQMLKTSNLAKYVHIESGSKYMKLIRYEQLIAAGENSPLLIDDSKKAFLMVLPDINSNINNIDAARCFSNGCQFVGMKYQNLDNNLVNYLKHFTEKGGFSFILKPYNLRRDEIAIDTASINS